MNCCSRPSHQHVFSSSQGHLYLLVTDQGFLQEEQVVWESLHNVDGDSCFCDSDFHLSHSPGKGPGSEGGSGSPEKQRQVDQVCGALGVGVGCRERARPGELCAQGEQPVSYHLETVTYDTGPLCGLWTISALGVCSLASQIKYAAVCFALEEKELGDIKDKERLSWFGSLSPAWPAPCRSLPHRPCSCPCL